MEADGITRIYREPQEGLVPDVVIALEAKVINEATAVAWLTGRVMATRLKFRVATVEVPTLREDLDALMVSVAEGRTRSGISILDATGNAQLLELLRN